MIEKDVEHPTHSVYYVVAGDEMQKLMRLKFPERKTIPFREDFSKGEGIGFDCEAEFVEKWMERWIEKRASFWQVSQAEYREKLSPILQLDMTKRYVLCFGEDDCCRANLAFMLGYLQYKRYSHAVKVQILNEYTLALQREYFIPTSD